MGYIFGPTCATVRAVRILLSQQLSRAVALWGGFGLSQAKL